MRWKPGETRNLTWEETGSWTQQKHKEDHTNPDIMPFTEKGASLLLSAIFKSEVSRGWLVRAGEVEMMKGSREET